MDYFFEEELLMLIPGMITGVPSFLFSVASYVLTSLAIYGISCRRGLRNAWFAWVPVLNLWLLGSVSDQYQYVVKGQTKSKRKWLLALAISQAVLWIAAVVLGVAAAGSAVMSRRPDAWMGPVLGLLGVLLPIASVAIARFVIRCMALFDVYRSLDPSNAVLYLVLSILFRPTEPFFLFFNREKDLGMPPRKNKSVEAPVYEADQEYVTVDETEYL